MKRGTLTLYLLVLSLCVSVAYALPTVDSVSIAASTPNNYTLDNLTATVVNPSDSYVVDWQVYSGGSYKSIAEILMNFNYNGSSVNTTDLSSNNRTGIFANGVTYTLTGGHGSTPAFDFDGVDDRIDLPVLSNMNGYGNITISAWIYARNASRTEEIVRQESSLGVAPDWIFSFQKSPTCETGAFCLTFGLKTTVNYDELDVNISPSDFENGWHLVTAVYNGTTKMVYRDGVLIGTKAWTGTIVTEGICASIGGYQMSGCTINTENFNGTIDDVAIYNHALGADAVKQLYYNNPHILGGGTGGRQETFIARVVPYNLDQKGVAVLSTTNISLLAKPNTYSFSGATTNFWSVPNVKNVSAMVLQKGASKIAWSGTVNAENQDYDSKVSMGTGFVSVDAAALQPSVNNTATVSVGVDSCDTWNIYYYSQPATSLATIKASGVKVGTGTFTTGTCSQYCSNPSCSDNVLTYTVGHFDSTGGEGTAAAPEFSTVAMIVALAVVLGAILVRRQK